MIDLVKAKNAFNDYIKDYDMSHDKVYIKVTHTYGVVEMSEYLAKDLGLDEENIELAKLIALLHDIGRFEQAKEFNNFEDYNTIDHAEYGVKVLFDNNLIRNFIEEDKYDNIIYKAILNHNKYSIEDGMSEQELLHSKIIRDSDKTDNFRVKSKDTLSSFFDKKVEEAKKDTISDHIYNDFLEHKLIVSSTRKTDMDKWVSFIAFIFDYNFNSGLKYIKEHNCINTLIDRIEYDNEDTKNRMEVIRKCALEYIEDKCK